MKKNILFVICGLIIVVMLLAGALVVWAVYDELTEPPLVREVLLDDDVELDVQGDDIQALLEETETLLGFGEAGWNLGRVDARQERNGEDTKEYTDVYLYYNRKDGTYRQEDGTESVCRRIRLFKENGRWIVKEAYELNQGVYMAGTLSSPVLEELLGLAEEQMAMNNPEYDEYRINTTSDWLSITVFQENGNRETMIAEYLSFRIEGTETKFRLREADYKDAESVVTDDFIEAMQATMVQEIRKRFPVFAVYGIRCI